MKVDGATPPLNGLSKPPTRPPGEKNALNSVVGGHGHPADTNHLKGESSRAVAEAQVEVAERPGKEGMRKLRRMRMRMLVILHFDNWTHGTCHFARQIKAAQVWTFTCSTCSTSGLCAG